MNIIAKNFSLVSFIILITIFGSIELINPINASVDHSISIGKIQAKNGNVYNYYVNLDNNKITFLIEYNNKKIELNSNFKPLSTNIKEDFTPENLGDFSVQLGEKLCKKECNDGYINWLSTEINKDFDQKSLEKIGTMIGKAGDTNQISELVENLIKKNNENGYNTLLKSIKEEISKTKTPEKAETQIQKIIDETGERMIKNGNGDSYLDFLANFGDKEAIKAISSRSWFQEYIDESIKNAYITGETKQGLKKFIAICDERTCNIDKNTIATIKNEIGSNENIVNYISYECKDDVTSNDCKNAREEMSKYLNENDIEKALYVYFSEPNKPLTDKNLDKVNNYLFSDCKNKDNWCKIDEELLGAIGWDHKITKESIVEAGISWESKKILKEECSNGVTEECLAKTNEKLSKDRILDRLCKTDKNCKESLKGTVIESVKMSQYVDTNNKYYTIASTYSNIKREKEEITYGVQALCDLNLFSCESRWSFYKNNPQLQMIFGTPIANLLCYSKLKGYINFGEERKEIRTNDGTTGYLQSCNANGCDVNVEYDLRAQMTPPVPDNTTYLTYSYFYKYYGAVEKKNKEGKTEGYNFKNGEYTIVLSFLTKDGIKKAVALFNLQPLTKGKVSKPNSIEGKVNQEVSSTLFIPKEVGDVVTDSKTIKVNLGVKPEDIDLKSFRITLIVFDASKGPITKSNVASRILQRFSAPVVVVTYNSPLTVLKTQPQTTKNNPDVEDSESSELSTQDIVNIIFT